VKVWAGPTVGLLWIWQWTFGFQKGKGYGHLNGH
jgi:hypothetical protein